MLRVSAVDVGVSEIAPIVVIPVVGLDDIGQRISKQID